jgi:5-methylcytosine-specific restriction endonuclease McrA
MSQRKKQVRDSFRQVVFERDHYRCAMCGARGGKLDAHHITDRSLMPAGGYVAANGITLCEPCHARAEQYHATGVAYPGHAPDDLYRQIGSSFEEAQRDSLALG